MRISRTKINELRLLGAPSRPDDELLAATIEQASTNLQDTHPVFNRAFNNPSPNRKPLKVCDVGSIPVSSSLLLGLIVHLLELEETIEILNAADLVEEAKVILTEQKRVRYITALEAVIRRRRGWT